METHYSPYSMEFVIHFRFGNTSLNTQVTWITTDWDIKLGL